MSDTKTERNARVEARYNELMIEGKHGHYEVMFRIVREEVEQLQTENERLAAAWETEAIITRDLTAENERLRSALWRLTHGFRSPLEFERARAILEGGGKPVESGVGPVDVREFVEKKLEDRGI